jgi:lysophospholipase L1-like esterase
MSPPDAPSQRSNARRGRLRRGLGFGLACVAVLALVEGASSLLHFAGSLRALGTSPLAERRHTRYDPTLGWVHTPGVRLADFYGPGRSLTINAQGFRGRREVAARVAEGRTRIVCSGDSFTLGYGVDDEQTWCARLEAREPRFETVNMGQGGYGIDQAYLWYRRDAAMLDHHVQVFAFITADFGRLLSDRFQGYGKPVLRVKQGELVLENTPVPRAAFALPWLAEHRAAFDELRSLALLRRGLAWLRPAPPDVASQPDLPGLTAAIFAALARLNAEKGSQLVLCYLPTRAEHGGALDARLPVLVRRTAEALGIAYVDLLEAQRGLPPAQIASLYLDAQDLPYAQSAGHLSVAGNQWVADRLYERIVELPAVRGRLER